MPIFFSMQTWAASLESSCIVPLYIPDPPKIDDNVSAEHIQITADDIEVQTKNISQLSGNVELAHQNQQLRANAIEYNRGDNTAKIHTNIQYWDNYIYAEADTAEIDFSNDSSQLKQAIYKIKDNQTHGHSRTIASTFGVATYLQDATYSSCNSRHKFWEISANQITFDHVKNWGNATGVLLKIKNVPILYSPYISFPLTEQRKTGFLAPKFGSSSRHGNEWQIPFYWNLRSYMDVTFTPRFLTKNGPMLAGEIRHISDNSHFQTNFEYLPKDKLLNDKHRSLSKVSYLYQFNDKGHFLLDYSHVSDNQYFEDFGSNIDITSTRFLQQHAELSYQGKSWDSNIRLDSHQIIDQTISNNQYYERLPQISFNAYSPFTARQFHYALRSELTYFDTDNTSSTHDVTGARLNLETTISYLYNTDAAFISPTLALHYTQYKLNKTPLFASDSSRLVPEFSIDSGITLERELIVLGRKSLQLLEPRIFYLYVPVNNQDDLPIFDTSLHDISFNSLFRKNRFSGKDRFDDANHLTLALTSSLIDYNSGRERGYLHLGQTYYFNNRTVNLLNRSIMQNNSSPMIAELGTRLSKHWNFKGEFQWEPHNSGNKKSFIQTQYKKENTHVLNLAYYRHTTESSSTITPINIEQADLSFYWSLRKQWNIIGRWNYGFNNNTILDSFSGIEYSSCCWGVRGVVRHFLANTDGTLETGVFLEFELKNLFSAGRDTINLLQHNIPGYKQ